MNTDKSGVPVRAYSVRDFCKAYGLGRSTTYEMIKAGRLKSIRIGGRRLIPAEAAEALIREAV